MGEGMKRPLAVCCFAWFAVLIALCRLPQALPLAAVLFLVFTLLSGAFFLGRRPKAGAPWLPLLLCCAAGLLACGRFGWYNAVREKALAPLAGKTVAVQAVVEEVTWQEDTAKTTLLLKTAGGEPLPTAVRAEAWALEGCEPGMQITARLQWKQAGAAARAKGIWLYGYPEGEMRVTGETASLVYRLNALQGRLSAALRAQLNRSAGQTAAAVCTGDRAALSQTLVRNYRLSGLSHLLAVSGMHLSVVCGLVLAFLPRRRRILRFAAGCTVIVLYTVLTGASVSVLRAGAMLFLILLADLLSEQADGTTSLAAALFCITWANPAAAGGGGLLLSACATGGVLWAGQCWQLRFPAPPQGNPFWQAGAGAVQMAWVSLAALVATVPASILAGTQISVWALPAGLLTIPLLPVLLGSGLLGAAAMQTAALYPLGRPLVAVCGVLCRWQNRVAEFFASLGGGRIYLSGVYPLLCCGVLLVAGWLLFSRAKKRTAACCMVVLVAAAVCFGTLAGRGTVQVGLVGGGQRPVLAVANGKQAVVLWQGGSASTDRLENWLEMRNVETVLLFCDLSAAGSGAPRLSYYQPKTYIKPVQDITVGATYHPWPNFTLTVERQPGGMVVYLDFDGILAGYTTGTPNLAGLPAFDLFFAGKEKPNALACTALFANGAVPWPQNAGVPQTVVGQNITLSIRPKTSWKLTEKEEN